MERAMGIEPASAAWEAGRSDPLREVLACNTARVPLRGATERIIRNFLGGIFRGRIGGFSLEDRTSIRIHHPLLSLRRVARILSRAAPGLAHRARPFRPSYSSRRRW